ncbi:unnamed protein product [Prorocentrum cordatum]|uniref:Mono(ADP-ribosyl)transferase n=1 Tax=Prorocentrum cordatum TaxID=2364126 RepID=A0ABN9QSE7_9DINO|nr:unnamed protein product [Polarella glacialis]
MFKDLKKTLSTWSAVRAEAKKIATAIVMESPSAVQVPFPVATTTSDVQSGESLNGAEKLLKDFFSNQEYVEVLADFVSNNPSEVEMSVSHLPCFPELMSSVWSLFEAYAKANMPPKKDKTRTHSLLISKMMDWIGEVFNFGDEHGCRALADMYLAPAGKIAIVWANPDSYGDFVIPEEKISLAVQVFRGEGQYKSSLLQMDCRCIGVGRKLWLGTWNSALEMILDAIIEGKITGESEEGEYVIIDEACNAAQTLWGIQDASKDAQAAFDRQIDAVRSAADAANTSAGTERSAIVPSAASGPGLGAKPTSDRTVTLGNIGDVLRYQDAALFVDQQSGCGATVRDLLATKHSTGINENGLFKIPKGEVTSAYVKQICLAIEGHLFNLAFRPNQADEANLRIDANFIQSKGKAVNTIDVIGKEKLFKEDSAASGWKPKLYFAGCVSTTRSKQCFHIMTICGVSIQPGGEGDAASVKGKCAVGAETSLQIPVYLAYEESQHGVMADSPVPAWLVPVRDVPAAPVAKGKAKPKPEAAMPFVPPAAPMVVAFQGLQLKLPKWLSIGDITDCPVYVPCLVPTDLGCSLKAPLKLWRYAVPDEKMKSSGRGSQAQAAEITPPPPKELIGSGALINSKASGNSPEAKEVSADKGIPGTKGLKKSDYLHLLK